MADIEPCFYCGQLPEQMERKNVGLWEDVFPKQHKIVCTTPECAGQETRWTFQKPRCVANWNANVKQKQRIVRNAVVTPAPLFRGS